MLRIHSIGDGDPGGDPGAWPSAGLARFFRRAEATPVEVERAARAVLDEVRARGDAAVREFTARFEGRTLEALEIDRAEWHREADRVDAEVARILARAHGRILRFHEAEAEALRHAGFLLDERTAGAEATLRLALRPLHRVGLYAPGGTARYPSTVLMTAVPARVAGVPELVLCVPPAEDGSVDQATLAAAALAGVDEVYRVGGAQAIAAMAYGTESIRPVDVIVGPGNIYVSLAKREVAGVVGIPTSFAGPSEVVVIADETTPVDYAAIDVVVQAEHGPDGLAWLITWSEEAADRITEAVTRLVNESPRRAEIESTLSDGGYAVLVDGPEQALAVSNAIAPEHLELMTADPDALVPLVQSAGAVFTGAYAPASVGDYVAGPSHVLPTYGSARYASALRVDDFLKQIHVVSLDEPTLARLAPHVAAIAEAEGLAAHAESVRMRRSP
jgi:histidinol dehydrogenase